jgi:hypothetical protein
MGGRGSCAGSTEATVGDRGLRRVAKAGGVGEAVGGGRRRPGRVPSKRAGGVGLGLGRRAADASRCAAEWGGGRRSPEAGDAAELGARQGVCHAVHARVHFFKKIDTRCFVPDQGMTQTILHHIGPSAHDSL